MLSGNIYYIAAVAVIGGGLFGFDIASMSAILGTEQYRCYFDQYPKVPGKKCGGPKPNVQGGITASMAGGSWLGALISGYLSDLLGRKKSIMIGAVIWVIGSVLVCASNGIPMLIVGRIFNGFSVGICSAQVPVYISELAPPTKRGRLVGGQQWAITFVSGPAAFRIPWGLQAIPAILLFIGLLPLPESPRWLARNDRWDECRAILVSVHGKGDPHSPFVEREFKDIRDMCEFERQNADVTYLELLKPNMINRTHVGVFTQIWSQMTGMNVMMYYITYVFAMAGLRGNALLLSSSIQYVINVCMTVPALLWVDRWGRRPTLMVGAFFMMAFLFINAAVLATLGSPAPPGGLDQVEAQSWQIYGPPSKMIIAGSYLFVASFAPSWGPVSWIYPPELFPLRVRGKAVALCTSANWAFNFAIGYFTPPAFVNIKWQTYIVFGVFCAVMLVHVFFMFPETAGKTLEEVEDIFTKGGVKYIGTPAWRTKVEFHKAARLEQTGIKDEEEKLRDDLATPEAVATKAKNV
ncbi:high affinity glucose transporter [Emydomyces testavorans]|uniref:High affinity glucose transporter n=1 Tax=Emydomyces testavorans TaxID=2070801 RepID=A0AAF0IKP2_9EURO|nr:high affinity glucose transporter [Emydomyces testavorans]